MDSTRRTAKLKYHIEAQGFRQVDVAVKIGINEFTLNRKIQNPESFKVSEVNKLISVLNLSLNDVADIFLTLKSRLFRSST